MKDAADTLIYGLDLISDADGPLIDTGRHRILEIGLSLRTDEERYDGGEPELLELFDDRLRLLDPGVLVTWHGSILAIPLVVRRAQRWGLSLGLETWVDRRQAPVSPVVGVDEALCGTWHGHALLDLRRVYETSPSRRRPRLGRKGLDPEDLIPLPNELTLRDPCKDARLARQLAERRWPQAKKFVDVPTEHDLPTEQRESGDNAEREPAQTS